MNKIVSVALTSIAFFTCVMLLVSCEAQTPEEKQATVERKSRFIGEVDGCRVWEVYNPGNGPNPFLARCPEGAANTFEQHTTGGKTKTTVNTFTLGN